MSEKPIDFQGIVTLQYPLVKQLEQYLDEKKIILIDQLLSSILMFRVEPTHPALPSVPIISLKLSDAAEAFSKRAKLLAENRAFKPSLEERVKVVREVNEALWKYVEVLEGCIVELFQQVKLEGMDQWHSALPHSLEAIKDLILQCVEDLRWTIRRLKNPLWQYRWLLASQDSLWTRLIEQCFFWRNPLDPSLLVNLDSSEKFLKSQYQSFKKVYDQYVKMDSEAKERSFNLHRYVALELLEKDYKILYKQMYRLLKLWALAGKDNGTLSPYVTIAIKNVVGVDRAAKLFKRYHEHLRDSLYALSRDLKKVPLEGDDGAEMKQNLKNKTILFMEELRDFMDLMASYRGFILKTNPNPYIRSRFGFTEWIVGPEPLKTKALTQEVYEVKALYNQFNAIFNSLEEVNAIPIGEIYSDIERLLHQMASPLISREMLRRRGGILLDDLGLCNILGNINFERVDYVGRVLDQAMRLDWKYHVLHEFSSFHTIVEQYKGLVHVDIDPMHEGRLKEFQNLFFHIEAWLAREDIDTHINDIAIEMNDMKTYLQDLLAAVQRMQKDRSCTGESHEHAIKQFRYQLLEYRYFFGDFFLRLTNSEGGSGIQLRNHFLFVDQYFETIEMLLYSS
jgi:hypothetical protein